MTPSAPIHIPRPPRRAPYGPDAVDLADYTTAEGELAESALMGVLQIITRIHLSMLDDAREMWIAEVFDGEAAIHAASPAYTTPPCHTPAGAAADAAAWADKAMDGAMSRVRAIHAQWRKEALTEARS